MDEAEIYRLALRRWQEREMGFPAFARRMMPDAIDMENGTWHRVVREVMAGGEEKAQSH